MNERVGENKGVGSVTCAGASIVDYVIYSSQIYPKICDFIVHVFDTLQSDKHKPIICTISMN